jgi:hypothetical protein
MMNKNEIIENAILNRNRIRFRYGFKNIMLEPYFSKQNSTGKQILYGRIVSKNEIEKFDFDKMIDVSNLNLRKFSPIIPISQLQERKNEKTY